MNTSQLIKSFGAKRSELDARLKEILKAAAEDSDGPRTLNDAEQHEFDSVEKELASVDSHIKRLEKQRAADAETAQAPNADADRYTGQRVIVKASNELPKEDFKGQRYTQWVKAKAVSAMDHVPVSEAFRSIYGDNVGGMLAKAADPVSRSDVDGLVGPATQDFVEILRQGSVYDLMAFRRIKADLPIARQLSNTVGYWVAEGADVTSSKWTAERFSLTPLKVGGIVPATKESIRDSSPSADRQIMQDLVDSLRIRADLTLLGTAGASTGTPAGLLNGVTPIVTSGTDAEDLVADLKGLRGRFPRELQGMIELLMGPELAADIASMRTTLNVRVFDGMTAKGGVLEGYPVTVTTGVAAGRVIALIPSEIYSIADAGVEVAVSMDATIDGTSLFQADMVGFRAIRPINWDKRRDDVVQYIATAAYGATASGT